MGHTRDGILLVDKEAHQTSADVVRRAKTVFRTRGIDKIGHAGTLDPFATGLLILLLGQGTKLSPFLMSGSKRYLATVRLGIETDSLDPTGSVTRARPVPHMELNWIRETAAEFVGRIQQKPPGFSAVKHQGRRAYQWAREGVPVELKTRDVLIHTLEVVSVALPEITIEVECSAGTYIRSLAADLATCLGTGGHLTSLRRLRSGPFHVNAAVRSSVITREGGDTLLGEMVISPAAALPEIPELELEEDLTRRVRQGYQPTWREVTGDGAAGAVESGYVKLITGNHLVAVAKIFRGSEDDVQLKVQRVFH